MKMSTLREIIKKKFEFDDYGAQDAAMTHSHDLQKSNQSFWIGARWQHDQLKTEVLPILLDCVEALEEISLNKTMTVYSDSEEFMDGANTAFCRTAEISDEALERLRKWSEG